MTPTRRMATAAAGAILAFGLVACGSDDDASDDATAEESNDSASETEEDAPEDDAPEDDADADDADEDDADVDEAADSPNGAGDGDAPEWAAPVTTPGELIATLEGDNFEVEVYQVGVTESPKDGMLVDPDDNEPVLAEGDDIVFVNYVVTNTSDEPINLSASLVSMKATYEDWPYLQGMDSITDFDLYDEMEVNNSGTADHHEDGIYPLGPGQTLSYGENFMYKTDAAVVFEATLTPVDDDGELLSDERQEVAAEVTLS
ncbi:hypothetical protein F7O44_15885 [Phytoactinopolyspora sp. XMNu-373]|uniref:DUF4352 domain-containing protein n=2 Tax=Phytoactinopolyspora mesophila TaxID=2650750 RepID=A0A7K3M5F6_9ACTN|nr:hypothetical protein [Phytoactinopolyspora mesophila]